MAQLSLDVGGTLNAIRALTGLNPASFKRTEALSRLVSTAGIGMLAAGGGAIREAGDNPCVSGSCCRGQG
jgi:hypothetical protein